MQNGGKRYGQKEVLSIAPECCHPLPLKLRVLKATGGSTSEQSIIVVVDERDNEDNIMLRLLPLGELTMEK